MRPAIWMLLSAVVGCAHPVVKPVVPACSAPTTWQKPLLWRIDGGKQHAYLLGTMHMPDVRVLVFPPSLASAFGEATALYTEIAFDPANMTAMIGRALLPPDQSLDKILKPEIVARLQKILTGRGLKWQMVTRMKVWLVMAMLTDLPALAPRTPGRDGTAAPPPASPPLDMLLTQRAHARQLATGGLETVGEQIDAMETATVAEQTAMLESQLASAERATTPSSATTLIKDTFFCGDAEPLARIIAKEGDALQVKMHEALFHARNQRMGERIAQHLRVDDTISLFAVGAGHVTGDDGVVARLGRAGFRLTRVP